MKDEKSARRKAEKLARDARTLTLHAEAFPSASSHEDARMANALASRAYAPLRHGHTLAKYHADLATKHAAEIEEWQ